MDEQNVQTVKDVSEEIGVDLTEVTGQISEATLHEAYVEGKSTFMVMIGGDEAGEEDDDAEDSEIEVEITITAKIL